MNEQKIEPTAQEINIAELSILLLQFTSLDNLQVGNDAFSDREKVALLAAKNRIRSKLADQIEFKRRQVNQK